MKFKSIFYTVLLVLVFSQLYLSSNSIKRDFPVNNNKEQFITSTFPSDYTYEIVTRDGALWVIVYDGDGKIIDEYPLY
jgi:hypothetical protein